MARTVRLGVESLDERVMPAASVTDVYAASLFQMALRRDSSANGISFWSNQLAVSSNRSATIERFLKTDEGYSVQVHDFYRSTLFRTPAPVDRSYWVGQLLGGSTLDTVQSQILGSDEAFGKVGNNPIHFLSVVYQRTLGRSLDTGGQAFWSGLLNRGVPRAEVARQILASPEATARTVLSQTQNAYQSILGRTLDAGGQSFWTTRPNVANNPYQIFSGVLASNEFVSGISAYIQNAPVGINRDDPTALAAGFIADRGRGTTNPLDLRDFASLGTSNDPVVVNYNQNVAMASIRGVYRGSYVANVRVNNTDAQPMQTRVHISITNVSANPGSVGNPATASSTNPFVYTIQGMVSVQVTSLSNTIQFPMDDSLVVRSVNLTQYPTTTDVPPRGGMGVATQANRPGGGIQTSFDFVTGVVTTTFFSYALDSQYESNTALTPIRFQR